METTVVRTDGADASFRELVVDLDKELWEMYPESMGFYAPKNIVDKEAFTILLLDGDIPFGCGCLRAFPDDSAMEIKRMFIKEGYRGKGHSKVIVRELLAWAKELGYTAVYLETGVKQVAAIALYRKMGFTNTENYGDYHGNEESVCFVKRI